MTGLELWPFNSIALNFAMVVFSLWPVLTKTRSWVMTGPELWRIQWKRYDRSTLWRFWNIEITEIGNRYDRSGAMTVPVQTLWPARSYDRARALHVHALWPVRSYGGFSANAMTVQLYGGSEILRFPKLAIAMTVPELWPFRWFRYDGDFAMTAQELCTYMRYDRFEQSLWPLKLKGGYKTSNPR